MITAIHIENFKSIRDRVKIDIKPITLLFGPNSSGKSSIIQALHYAREVLERDNLDADRTLIGGDSINLGGFKSLVHNHDLEKDISIRIDFEIDALMNYPNDDWQREELMEKYKQENEDDEESVQSWIEVFQNAYAAYVEIKVGWSYLAGRPIVKLYESGFNGHAFGQITVSDDGKHPRISMVNFEHPDLISVDLNSVRDQIVKIKSEADDENVAIRSEKLLKQFEALELETISVILCWQGFLLAQILKKGIITKDGKNMNIPIGNMKTALPKIKHGPGIILPPEVVRDIDDYEYVNDCEILLSLAFANPLDLLIKELNDQRYLGPLRRIPPRNYIPPQTYDDSRWTDGMGAWDLLSVNPDILKAVNKWMSDSDKLDTGYGVEIQRYREIAEESPLTWQIVSFEDGAGDLMEINSEFESLPLMKRLQIVDLNNDIQLLPFDVGVGLSQLIPVVTAVINDGDYSEFIILEQPGLHTHPRLQVRLGDLFIAEGVHGNKTLLIETHKEHILLRLLRRIRETADGEIPYPEYALTPDDLSVVYVEKDGGFVKIHQLRVNEEGEFDDKWPHGFFDERAEELF